MSGTSGLSGSVSCSRTNRSAFPLCGTYSAIPSVGLGWMRVASPTCSWLSRKRARTCCGMPDRDTGTRWSPRSPGTGWCSRCWTMAAASTRPGSGWRAAGTCAGPRSGPPGCSAAGPGPVTSRRSPSQAAAWRSCARAWTTSACTAALAGEPSCSCSSGASGATARRSPPWTAGRSGTPAERVTCVHGPARPAGLVVTARIGIVTFPGSLDDVDATRAVARAGGTPVPLWHGDRDLRGVDAVILPGGFSYGDYLRCGAIARFAPVMAELIPAAAAGLPVLGICNGFQVLVESGLLPGALLRNRDLKFVCRQVALRVETPNTPFTSLATSGQVLTVPVAHGDGCYFADEATLAKLKSEDRIVF